MPNPRVGCVLARDGVVIAEAYHRRPGEAHAEQAALRKLAPAAAAGCDVFVNLEPCVHSGRTPPCTGALIKARPRRVVVSITDPDPRVAGAGVLALRAAGIRVEVGLGAEAATWLNRGFISRHTRALPWVRLKTASSLDGRSSLADGTSKWITGLAARRNAHAIRAASCAVATGIGTALADDPELRVRLVRTERQPMRVLLDSNLRARAQMRMFAGGAVVATAVSKATLRATHLPAQVEVLHIPNKEGKVDLRAMLGWLAREKECNELTFEAGSRLAGALLKAKLVDEWVYYLAPKLLGPGLVVAETARRNFLPAETDFEIREVRRLGSDLKLTLIRP